MSLEAVALESRRKPGGSEERLLLTGAEVLDVNRGEWRRQDLLIHGDRFAEPSESAGDPEVIDCTGKWIIPGLIDCHVHIVAATADLGDLGTWPASYTAFRSAKTMRSMLDRGFTTVRDINGADQGLARAERESLILGPRVFFGGKGLSPTGGHSDTRRAQQYATEFSPDRPSLGRVADGLDGVVLAARDELRKGADHIKIMASGGIVSHTDRLDSLQYTAREISAIVEEAENAKRYVAAHAYTGEAIARAVDLGVRTIEHGNYLDREAATAMREAGAFLVPTAVVYRYLASDGPSQGLSAAQMAKVRNAFESAVSAIELAADAGVQMAFGTDLLGEMHAHQSEEFAIRSEVLPIIDVLRSATIAAARLLNADDQIGRIAPGYLADLVVLDRNPLEDIAAVSEDSPWLVVHDGVPTKPLEEEG